MAKNRMGPEHLAYRSAHCPLRHMRGEYDEAARRQICQYSVDSESRLQDGTRAFISQPIKHLADSP